MSGIARVGTGGGQCSRSYVTRWGYNGMFFHTFQHHSVWKTAFYINNTFSFYFSKSFMYCQVSASSLISSPDSKIVLRKVFVNLIFFMENRLLEGYLLSFFFLIFILKVKCIKTVLVFSIFLFWNDPLSVLLSLDLICKKIFRKKNSLKNFSACMFRLILHWKYIKKHRWEKNKL